MKEKFLIYQKVSMFHVKTDFLLFKKRFQYWNNMWKIFPWMKIKSKNRQQPNSLVAYECGIINVILQKMFQKCFKCQKYFSITSLSSYKIFFMIEKISLNSLMNDFLS